MHIGIAGLGRMGAAMALRLLERGHIVTVWNRSPDRCAPLVEAGALITTTPAELASSVEVALTILTDAAAISAVYEGADGLLFGEVAGKTLIEMSTVRPHVIEALAERVRAKGAALIDCPVGGTVGPAREGKLLGLAGGAKADFARVRPLLLDLCRRVEHVGGHGAGAAMKLAINLPLSIAHQALGEAYILCRGLGLDPAFVMDIMADSSGATTMLKNRHPLIAAALAGRPSQTPPAVPIEIMRKDMETMLEEARHLGAELPLSSVMLAVLEQATKAGWGERDGTAMPSFWPACQAGRAD